MRIARLAAATLLAACGGGADDADDAGDGFAAQSARSIVEQAEEDTTGASALRVRGDLAVDGQVVTLDLRVDQDAQCEGTVGRDGVAADVLGVDGSYWFRPDEAYWRASLGADDAAAVVAAQQGRWIATDGVARLCDPVGLFGSAPTDPDVQLATVGVGEVDGQQAVRVRRTDAEGRSTISAVATSSPHHLLRVVGEGADRGTRVDLGEYGVPLTVEAPAPDDQVPLADLPVPG